MHHPQQVLNMPQTSCVRLLCTTKNYEIITGYFQDGHLEGQVSIISNIDKQITNVWLKTGIIQGKVSIL